MNSKSVSDVTSTYYLRCQAYIGECRAHSQYLLRCNEIQGFPYCWLWVYREY